MLKKPFFSIVTPTLNEEKYLPLLLEDLAKQTCTDFEVIHVDGNSEDQTVKKAGEWKRKIFLKTEKTKIRNVAFQRNLGADKARGKWVIFMDADNRLPNYFLQGLKYQIDKNPDVGVFTTWIQVEKDLPLGKTMESAINLGYEVYSLIGKDGALGALIGAKAEVVKKIKFREKAQIFEDSFFVQDAEKLGYKFQIFKEPRYFFSLRRVKKEGSLKMFNIVAKAQINYILLGKNFEKDNHGYVMKGGGYYDEQSPSPLKNLQSFIEKASRDQLTRAKKLLKNIQNQLEI
ncbi:MAG: glycosyltransferase family 2 protein [Patescibacteria group bacterium]